MRTLWPTSVCSARACCEDNWDDVNESSRLRRCSSIDIAWMASLLFSATRVAGFAVISCSHATVRCLDTIQWRCGSGNFAVLQINIHLPSAINGVIQSFHNPRIIEAGLLEYVCMSIQDSSEPGLRSECALTNIFIRMPLVAMTCVKFTWKSSIVSRIQQSSAVG